MGLARTRTTDFDCVCRMRILCSYCNSENRYIFDLMILRENKNGADTTTQNFSVLVISTPALLSISVKLVLADDFYFTGKHTLWLLPPVS